MLGYHQPDTLSQPLLSQTRERKTGPLGQPEGLDAFRMAFPLAQKEVATRILQTGVYEIYGTTLVQRSITGPITIMTPSSRYFEISTDAALAVGSSTGQLAQQYENIYEPQFARGRSLEQAAPPLYNGWNIALYYPNRGIGGIANVALWTPDKLEAAMGRPSVEIPIGHELLTTQRMALKEGYVTDEVAVRRWLDMYPLLKISRIARNPDSSFVQMKGMAGKLLTTAETIMMQTMGIEKMIKLLCARGGLIQNVDWRTTTAALINPNLDELAVRDATNVAGLYLKHGYKFVIDTKGDFMMITENDPYYNSVQVGLASMNPEP